MKNLFKIIISVWIFYHLATIFLMPNGNSYVGRMYQQAFSSYANTFGLNSTWQFFSPDPAHMLYFEYDVYFYDNLGEPTQETIRGYFPDERDAGTIHPSLRRNMYLMRYLAVDPVRMDRFVMPWLCRKYPGASSVSLKVILNQIPLLDEVTRKWSPMLVTQEIKMQTYTKDCAAAEDEVIE